MSNEVMHQFLFLAPQEVELLTGHKQTRLQINWLIEKGWRFVLNGNRRPVIARRYVEKMLGCGGDYQESPKPNFSALG
jgi:hypothetical protein